MCAGIQTVVQSVRQAAEVVRFGIDSVRYSIVTRWFIFMVVVFVVTLSGGVWIVEYITR